MSQQFDILPGLDPSSLTSITQAQLLQMISQMAPLSNIGGIIVMSGASSAHPDVTNNNRFTRYVWIDTQTANSPVLKLYTGNAFSDTYADWSAFAVPNNSITTAMLQALCVTVAKMSSSGGTNGQLLKVNAAGSYDFVDFSSLLTAGIVPLTALDKSAAADGQILQFRSADGLVLFRSIDPSVFAAGSFAISKLANIGSYSFFAGDINGAPITLHFDTSAKVGNYFDALTIPLTRLEGTGAPNSGDYLSWNGSNWVKTLRKVTTADIAMVSATALIASTAHNLGITPIPKMFLINKAANVAHGYAIGDAVPVESFTQSNNDGTTHPLGSPVQCWVNSINYGFNCILSGSGFEVNIKTGTAKIYSSAANLILDWNARLVLTI